MSFMLASVSNVDEAKLVQSHQVDIIDLKHPASGALGALDCNTIKTVVECLKPHARISATIGDLPMHRQTVCDAVANIVGTGVDYVKIGFFPGGDSMDCIEGLALAAGQGYALIAVLFADNQPDFKLIPVLAQAGFRGVMLDTMHKQQGSLTSRMTNVELQNFVDTCKGYGLLCGLAGSLSATDIATLLPLNADYLGFRGALCRQGRRIAELDPERVLTIRGLMRN